MAKLTCKVDAANCGAFGVSKKTIEIMPKPADRGICLPNPTWIQTGSEFGTEDLDPIRSDPEPDPMRKIRSKPKNWD
ncbi:hypothetical protein L596_025727 [Steinernema carpocapsae]|uniref:Uncharacterized protein n=1 Tax=Steinernema carpocapsae TaxID=34508 RepID=A0A4U5M8N6_STECR|nr:hypothetical protein L596_025727 [Steinernema carpocapsae]